MLKVELLHLTPVATKVIEAAGRTAYLSFDKETDKPIIQGECEQKKRIFRAEEYSDLSSVTEGEKFYAEGKQWSACRVWRDSAEKFVEMLIKSRHFSVLEHVTATFRFSGESRAFTHQLVRHRMASFTQQSQRYVNEKNFSIVEPPTIARHPEAHALYSDFMSKASSVYNQLQKMGIRNEDARFVLPNSVCSEIVVTADLREWRHILELRGASKAQWEIREAAIIVFKRLVQEIPSAFIDMELNEEKGVLKKAHD